MKKYYFLFLLFTLLVAACSDDNDDSSRQSGNSNENANAITATTDAAVRRLEVPRLKQGNRVLVKRAEPYGVNLVIEWNDELKAQRWTSYELYDMSGKGYQRGSRSRYWPDGDPFQADTDIPTAYRTVLADYRNSGYDRGHICPSADRLWSKEANEQTFILSNIQPQLHLFNTGIWEQMEQHITGNTYSKITGWDRDAFRDTLYICKGGTIEDYGSTQGVKTTTTRGILVPNYFFMAILCVKNGQYKALGFWVQHENNVQTDVSKYVVSIDELENLTGIDFFCNLPDNEERVVEATVDKSLWGL